MTLLAYDDAPMAIRNDLVAAHERAWDRIAHAGTWLTGAERVVIAAETRNAATCALCRERKAALSPHAIDGAHDSLGELPAETVDVVHRVATDPGRLTHGWYLDLLDRGVADTAYVETVAVVVTVVAVDTFRRGIGMAPAPLPQPVEGAPPRVRPQGAKQGPAWVPWIDPADAAEPEADLYYRRRPAHIRRALTLVPDEARALFDLVENQYLTGAAMTDFAQEYRAISHAQIELIAARVSALNQCVY